MKKNKRTAAKSVAKDAPKRSSEAAVKSAGKGATKAKAKRHVQYAALPYKVGTDDGVQVMLVTSRETKRWIIPKGWPMKDRKPHMAAKIEAFEEAGVVGSIGKRPIGAYSYAKRLKTADTVSCKVEVFPLKVRKEHEEWPERAEREGRWFSPDEAASAVEEEELSEIIRRLPELVEPPTPTR